MLTEKMAIYAVANRHAEMRFDFTLVPAKKTWWMHDDDIKLEEIEITYDPPQGVTKEQLMLKAIDTLKGKQQHAMAQAQLKVNELQAKIDELMMLTHQPPLDDDVIEHVGPIDDIPF